MRRTNYESIEDAFNAHVNVLSLDECWIWTGSVCGAGYGQFTYRGIHYFAHQVAYELLIGPRTLNVLHDCDNRVCCNPCHLWHGTQSQNMSDAVKKGRISNLILHNVELGKIKTARRALRPPDLRARDEWGRIKKKDGYVPLPNRQRDSHGLFICG